MEQLIVRLYSSHYGLPDSERISLRDVERNAMLEIQAWNEMSDPGNEEDFPDFFGHEWAWAVGMPEWVKPYLMRWRETSIDGRYRIQLNELKDSNE